MWISMKHFDEYTSQAPPYINGLVFRQSGLDKKDVDALKMWLRRFCADNEGLSFMLVTSCTESKGNIRKVKIYTGKAGRPKTVVKGRKAVNHCHGLIVNENTDNDIEEVKKQLQTYCNKRRTKRPDMKRQQIIFAWEKNLSIIKYMARQSNSTYRYGTFDFDYFLSTYYMPPKPNNYDNILDFEEVHETYIQ